MKSLNKSIQFLRSITYCPIYPISSIQYPNAKLSIFSLPFPPPPSFSLFVRVFIHSLISSLHSTLPNDTPITHPHTLPPNRNRLSCRNRHTHRLRRATHTATHTSKFPIPSHPQTNILCRARSRRCRRTSNNRFLRW